MFGKYPHDRVVFFSDAVFAIAITLLVIEIKVPSHETIHELGLRGALAMLTPLFIGYGVSFIVTALFWRAHLQLCTLVTSFNSKLIWTNIVLLLFVGMMPFSTALYSENFGNNAAFTSNCLNLAAIGITNFFLTRVIISSQHLRSTLSKKEIRWLQGRALAVPVIFLLCIAITVVSPMIARVAFILIFIVQKIGDNMLVRSEKAADVPAVEEGKQTDLPVTLK